MRTRNAMQLKAIINNRAREAGISPAHAMQAYVLERLVVRLSGSSYRDTIIVKGGVLIGSLIGVDKRTTMDLDTTARASPSPTRRQGRRSRRYAASMRRTTSSSPS